MDLKKMLGSKEYRDARARIDAWKARLGKGGAKDAEAVRDEKAEFFAIMRKADPGLYAAFQIDDKSLSETIYRKITGKDIILD